MASNYERVFYRDYDRALKENERLSAKIAGMETRHALDISRLKAEQAGELKSQKEEFGLMAAELKASIEGLHAEISGLKEENRKLRAQIDKNSSNSSKPPSSDGFRTVPNSREKSGRKPGGQKGHKGNIPVLIADPDETADLRPAVCGCGGRMEYAGDPVRKQVVDIVIKRHVTEYADGAGVCAACGKRHRPKFPGEAHNPMGVGSGMKTLAAALRTEYAMPLNKISQFVSDFTEGKAKLSEGTIVNACRELGGKIGPSVASIKERLFLCGVLHKDETGIKVDGTLEWLHTLATEKFTLYARDEKRGNDAGGRMGVLGGYAGTLVHDHLKALYAWNCAHAECNAHLLRYLKAVIENEPEYAAYAKEMLGLVLGAHRKRKRAKKRGQKKFAGKTIEAYRGKYDGILRRRQTKIKEVLRKAGRKSRYKREGEKLCPRLLQYKDEHLLFISDFTVPFDNNLAERALRGIKTKTKVSGGFRSGAGADVYANMRSYVETLRRQNMNIYRGISAAFSGEPVIF